MAGIPLNSLAAPIALPSPARGLALKDTKPTLKPLRPHVEAQNGSALSPAAAAKEQARLKKACQDFESIFLNYMLSKMRESVPKDELLGKSNGENIYRGMLDEELSKQIAASGGVGLSSMLYRQMGDPKR